MSEWKDKSDFEINKAVAEKLGYKVIEDFKWEEDQCWVKVESGDGFTGVFDYCDDASDAWPIITDNCIIVEPRKNKTALAYTKFDAPHEDKNPLRAAMIVYLEINGVKP